MSNIFKEITKWDCDYTVRNHVYLLDKDSVIAYAKDGGSEIVVFKSPIKINRRYRKFVETDHAELAKIAQNLNPKNTTDTRKFRVKSNKSTYIVEQSTSGYTCTCVGFSFRGKCKHIDAVFEQYGE